ncbi:lectin subunit alpha-like [Cochliomyia hominivorax]
MKTIFLVTVCCLLIKIVVSSPQQHQASDGKNYLIETDLKYNWYQAFHECARKGSQLLIIDSESKNNAIIGLLKKVVGKSHNLWLGGNDEFSSSPDYKRSFYWSATGEPFTFTFWSDNNPDNDRKSEHCVHIWDKKPLFQWNDIDCTTKMGFICETNHLTETYKTNLKNTCDAVKHTTSLISSDFVEVQKLQNSEINAKIQNIDQVTEVLKIDVQKLQNSTQTSIQHIWEEQQISLQQLTEKMLKQVSELNVELKKTTSEISSQFAQKLLVKETEINKVC